MLLELPQHTTHAPPLLTLLGSMECPSCHLPIASDLLQGVPAQSRWIRLVVFTFGWFGCGGVDTWDLWLFV